MSVRVKNRSSFIILLLLALMILPIPVAAKQKPKIEVTYFYIDVCPSCQANRQFISNLWNEIYSSASNRQVDIEVHGYNTANEQGLTMFKSYMQAYGAKDVMLPAVFVGDTYLSTDTEIRQKLKPLLESYINGTKEYKAIKVPIIKEEQVASGERARFESFTPIGIVLAGLLDGFNPCAVSMLLFFLSLLVMSGRQNRDLLLVGASYIAGTFIAYFAIGIGLFKVADVFKDARTVIIAIYGLTIIMSIVLAFFSFKDYASIKTGNYSEISLQLPQKLRHVIQNYVRTNAVSRLFYLSAFAAGVVVSGLEFFCTGQVYLPTIVYILSIKVAVMKALAYLLMYNLAFIIPLAAVIVAVYMGKKVMSLSQTFVSRMHIVKFATGLFFVTIAVIMFIKLWSIV